MAYRETGPAFLWGINQFDSPNGAQLEQATASLDSYAGVDPLTLLTNVNFSFDDEPGRALTTDEKPGKPQQHLSKLMKPHPSPMGPELWKQALASLDDGEPAPVQPSLLSVPTERYATLSRRQALLSALGSPAALAQLQQALESANACCNPSSAEAPSTEVQQQREDSDPRTIEVSSSVAPVALKGQSGPSASPPGYWVPEHLERTSSGPRSNPPPSPQTLKRTRELDDGHELATTSPAEDKRLRSMRASARFRQRKKQRIAALEMEQTLLQERLEALKEKNTRLREENRELHARFPGGPPKLPTGLA